MILLKAPVISATALILVFVAVALIQRARWQPRIDAMERTLETKQAELAALQAEARRRGLE